MVPSRQAFPARALKRPIYFHDTERPRCGASQERGPRPCSSEAVLRNGQQAPDPLQDLILCKRRDTGHLDLFCGCQRPGLPNFFIMSKHSAEKFRFQRRLKMNILQSRRGCAAAIFDVAQIFYLYCADCWRILTCVSKYLHRLLECLDKIVALWSCRGL